jgi:hypothetical protein
MSNGTHQLETTQLSESLDGSHQRIDQEDSYATSPVEAPCSTHSNREEHMVNKIRKAKLFVFLRQHRHELFDEAFRGASWQACIAQQIEGTHLLLQRCWRLSLILEAYTGVSDDEGIEATVMDRRWQFALDCLVTSQAPFEPWNPGRLSPAADCGTNGSALD